jgi:hypothetical protein
VVGASDAALINRVLRGRSQIAAAWTIAAVRRRVYAVRESRASSGAPHCPLSPPDLRDAFRHRGRSQCPNSRIEIRKLRRLPPASSELETGFYAGISARLEGF